MGTPVHLVDCSSYVNVNFFIRQCRNKLPADWEHLLLHDIEFLPSHQGPWARLICEVDEGGEMLTIRCPGRSLRALQPYADQLRAWKEDPYEVEKPVIPIFWDLDGSAHFSVEAARLDFPELASAASDLPQNSLLPGLRNQIRKAFRQVAAAAISPLPLTSPDWPTWFG